MIDYQPAESPFYEINRKYCEQVTKELDALGSISSGFCNSYGYDINAQLTYNGLRFDVNFHKHQSTMQSEGYPVDAVNYSDLILKISTLKNPIKLALVNKGIKALFVPGKNKYILENGQTIKSTKKLNQKQLSQLIQIINKYSVSSFRINKGIVYCRLNSEGVSTQELMNEVEFLIKEWA